MSKSRILHEIAKAHGLKVMDISVPALPTAPGIGKSETITGSAATTETFPCPRCGKLAEMEYITSHYEWYVCTNENCNHSFSVR